MSQCLSCCPSTWMCQCLSLYICQCFYQYKYVLVLVPVTEPVSVPVIVSGFVSFSACHRTCLVSFSASVNVSIPAWHGICLSACHCLWHGTCLRSLNCIWFWFRNLSLVLVTASVNVSVNAWHGTCLSACYCLWIRLSGCLARNLSQCLSLSLLDSFKYVVALHGTTLIVCKNALSQACQFHVRVSLDKYIAENWGQTQ